MRDCLCLRVIVIEAEVYIYAEILSPLANLEQLSFYFLFGMTKQVNGFEGGGSRANELRMFPISWNLIILFLVCYGSSGNVTLRGGFECIIKLGLAFRIFFGSFVVTLDWFQTWIPISIKVWRWRWSFIPEFRLYDAAQIFLVFHFDVILDTLAYWRNEFTYCHGMSISHQGRWLILSHYEIYNI